MRNSSREMWSSGCTFWKESNASLISDRMSAHVTSNTPGLTSRLTSSAALGLRLAQKCTCSETKSEMRLGKASTRERLSIAIFRIARQLGARSLGFGLDSASLDAHGPFRSSLTPHPAHTNRYFIQA